MLERNTVRILGVWYKPGEDGHDFVGATEAGWAAESSCNPESYEGICDNQIEIGR